MSLSVWDMESTNKGKALLESKTCLAVRGQLVMHKMVLCGLYLETKRTVFPESERQMIKGALRSQADFTAEEAIDSDTGTSLV